MRVHGKFTATLAAISILAASLGATPLQEKDEKKKDRPVEEFNLGANALAIQGYDPVAYFPEGGGKPTKGRESIQHEYEGVRYRFVSKENLELFRKDPAKYEPAFGGWCAWAMAKDSRAKIDPKSFLVQDGRLLLFYDGFFNDTRKKWKKGDGKELLVKADANWKKQTAKKEDDR